MSIYEKVSEQLKDAMRARDAARTTALRGIRAAFIVALKEDNATTLSDDRCLECLRRMAKQRVESIEAYAGAGREDLAAVERAELVVIEEYLPTVADADTTRIWVQEAISASGATSVREMGKVMAVLMRDHRADVDGKLANRLAAELLAG